MIHTCLCCIATSCVPCHCNKCWTFTNHTARLQLLFANRCQTNWHGYTVAWCLTRRREKCCTTQKSQRPLYVPQMLGGWLVGLVGLLTRCMQVSNVVNCGMYLFSMSIFQVLQQVATSAQRATKLSESYDIFPENRPRYDDLSIGPNGIERLTHRVVCTMQYQEQWRYSNPLGARLVGKPCRQASVLLLFVG
jgi:hypothetical protein